MALNATEEDLMNGWCPVFALPKSFATAVPKTFTRDFLASITVFLAALPLCMGIAYASGAPVEAGLLTGVVGGLIVGFISGSSFIVSGPAAGLSVLVFEIVQNHGFKSLGLVMVLAGLIQALAGALRLGQLFRAVSPAVVHGMLAGIGVMLVVGQANVMIDHVPHGATLQNLNALATSLFQIANDHVNLPYAMFLGLATIHYSRLEQVRTC